MSEQNQLEQLRPLLAGLAESFDVDDPARGLVGWIPVVGGTFLHPLTREPIERLQVYGAGADQVKIVYPRFLRSLPRIAIAGMKHPAEFCAAAAKGLGEILGRLGGIRDAVAAMGIVLDLEHDMLRLRGKTDLQGIAVEVTAIQADKLSIAALGSHPLGWMDQGQCTIELSGQAPRDLDELARVVRMLDEQIQQATLGDIEDSLGDMFADDPGTITTGAVAPEPDPPPAEPVLAINPTPPVQKYADFGSTPPPLDPEPSDTDQVPPIAEPLPPEAPVIAEPVPEPASAPSLDLGSGWGELIPSEPQAEQDPAVAEAGEDDSDDLDIDVTEPEPIEPEPVEPEAIEPEVIEPEAIEPEVIEPEVIEPEAIEPEVIEPEVIEPEAIEPEAIEPEAIEPEVIEPEVIEPEPFEPKPIEPEPIEPEPIESEPIESEPIEPEPFEPKPIEPEPFEPEPIETAPVEPAPVPSEEDQDDSQAPEEDLGSLRLDYLFEMTGADTEISAHKGRLRLLIPFKTVQGDYTFYLEQAEHKRFVGFLDSPSGTRHKVDVDLTSVMDIKVVFDRIMLGK